MLACMQEFRCISEVFVCLEGEEQGQVFDVGASKHVAVETDRLCAVQVDRHTFGQYPRGAVKGEGGTIGFVRASSAFPFVHRVICHQFALVARQMAVFITRQLGLRECFRP